MQDKPLTTKQQRFVAEYIYDMNATRAARDAGYNPDWGRHLTKIPRVAIAINEALRELTAKKRTLLTQATNCLAELFTFNPRDLAALYPDDEALQKIAKLPPVIAACMEICVVRKTPESTVRIKLPSRQAALRDFAHTLKMMDEFLPADNCKLEDYSGMTKEMIQQELARQMAEQEDTYQNWSRQRIRDELDLPPVEGDDEVSFLRRTAPLSNLEEEKEELEDDQAEEEDDQEEETEDDLPSEVRAKIESLEEKLERRLPGKYRRFLASYTFGETPSGIFTMPTGAEGRLERFYCTGSYQASDDLLAAYNLYQNRIPENLLPIAWDSYGNQICISLDGADRGSIYIWHHEDEYLDDSPPDYHNVSLITESFDKFIAVLKNRPRSEKDILKSDYVWNQRDGSTLQAVDRWGHSKWKHGPFKKRVWDYRMKTFVEC